MALAVINHHPTLRKARRAVRGRAHRAAAAGQALARRTPMPPALRTGLRERLSWQRDLRRVPIESLLLGGQNRLDAGDFATAVGDPWWASTRVVDGPHADLLRSARDRSLTDDDILGSGYAAMARAAIAASGQYFSATDDSGILTVARAFIADDPAPAPVAHTSAPGTPVEVSPVSDSDCYQVIDGHHRVARAALAGADTVEVRVKRLPVRTPLQQLLGAMSWMGGEPELYQPVEAPEVGTWPRVRRCVDRRDAMLGVIDDLGLRDGSYLDVASCHGWFVAAMRDAGLAAEGVEQDPLAPRLGALVHDLKPGAVHTSEAVTFLRAADRTWDVVSCFSLLHHFVLGRSEDSAEDLVRALDRAADRVLFLDTGQDHEAWFAESLAGWDAERVRDFLATHTTFDEFIDLGPDQDDRAPYAGNYGRHLFACVRHAPRA